jgi:hypothetical protein
MFANILQPLLGLPEKCVSCEITMRRLWRGVQGASVCNIAHRRKR